MSPNPKPVGGGLQPEPAPPGLEALERLRSASPPLFLSPSLELSRLAREASVYLFSSLLRFSPKPLPLDRLLAEESFDAEQIWHQIEIQSRPLVSAVRRDVRRLEKMGPAGAVGARVVEVEKKGGEGVEDSYQGKKGDDEDVQGEGAEEEEEDGEEEKDVERDSGEHGGEDDEGLDEEGEGEDGDDDDDDDEELTGNEFNLMGDDRGNEDSDSGLLAKYDDFFGGEDEKSLKPGDREKIRQSSNKLESESEGEESFDESDADFDQTDDEDFDIQNNEPLSTYEKRRKDLRSKIEQMERENLGPKSWTMLGEVTAAKRPKNSALEVALEFEHNKGRPPLTMEDDTNDVEEIILKRIREVSQGHLDEVQRVPSLPSKAPKEVKELDDSKSRKGLAELYEEEYAQKAGLAAAPLSFSDEQKKEASLLFKKLCLKLDALSHFHFAPKPVIEDMSIQANVPALAMEEVAPLAVSDAAMLAPEEIFSGKGDFKEDAELTQADRKRRRAKKKRKFKAEAAKRVFKKARGNGNMILQDGKEDP